MEALAYLIPVALFLGVAGLGAFFWSLKSGQFEDLDGAGMRILIDDEDALQPDDQGKTTGREAVKDKNKMLTSKEN